MHNGGRVNFRIARWAIAFVLAGIAFAGNAIAFERFANTSLAVPLNPPVYGYQAPNALGNLTFNSPVAIATAPGDTNRLFVVEKDGIIQVITNLAAPTKTVFLDISDHVNPSSEGGLLGLAFHANWQSNHRFFVYYTCGTNVPPGYAFYDRISRFEIDPTNPNRALPDSEVFLISQPDEAGNHNGGCVQFGPDGYLYVSIGDEGGGGDTYGNSRLINHDFFATILRLDVDKQPGSLEPTPHPAVQLDAGGKAYYSVPPDNPFIGATSHNGQSIDPSTVRTEMFATGLRNPWRFSFDSATGRLYCADVGQDKWEEVDIIQKGGDYGWNFREGLHAYTGTVPNGVNLLDPIIEYPHTGGTAIPGGTAQGNSISGGVVYNGNRYSQLNGYYVFGDYGSGRVFALRYDGASGQTMDFQQLTSVVQPVAFGSDPSNGDVLIVSIAGTVHRLIYSDNPTQGDPLPLHLSQTGAFNDLATLSPERGIVPYEVNLPFWSDHAIKSRWFSVPNLSDTVTFNRDSNWVFPTGAVWIKQFELEITNGVPSSRRRLETRFIVRSESGVHGFTYRWNANQTDADLVPEQGRDEVIEIHNPDGSLLREQSWHYPARTECLQCHTTLGGLALGFNTAQLNRNHDYGAGPENQIAALSDAGYFDAAVDGANTLPSLAAPDDASVSLERRVRSYLQANCGQCHQPGGAAQGNWDARIATATDEAELIDGALVNSMGDAANRVLVPGDVTHSVLLQKMSTRDSGQMPPIATSIPDPDGTALITEWINALPDRQSFSDWQIAIFGSTNAPDALADFDFDGDGASNYLEWLTKTDAKDPQSVWRIGINSISDPFAIEFQRIAERGFEVQYRQSLAPTDDWQTLDVPGNTPGYVSTNETTVINDAVPSAPARFYRVRVFPQ